MYPMFRFLARCSILTCLVFGLINRAVCRSDLFTNDLSDGDIGPDSFLDEPYGSSMLGQFTDDVPTENNLFANDLLADNLVANDGQSCRQPSKKFKARRSDGQSCTDADAPSSNDFTNSDERLLTNTEVRRYWCSSAAPNVYSVIPVCSLFPASQTYYDELPSTLMTPLNYIICADDRAFCCVEWYADRILDFPRILPTPRGNGYGCFKALRQGGLVF